jgi:hypothetical protein
MAAPEQSGKNQGKVPRPAAVAAEAPGVDVVVEAGRRKPSK